MWSSLKIFSDKALGEITIFSKRLSEAELKLLYDRTCRAAGIRRL